MEIITLTPIILSKALPITPQSWTTTWPSQITTLAHFPTGKRAHFLKPQSLFFTFASTSILIIKWKGLSDTDNIDFHRASHPLPLTPSRTIREEDFLFVTNFEILMYLPLLLKQISTKCVLDLPQDSDNSTTFFNYSKIHTISSSSKVTEKACLGTFFVTEIQGPTWMPSNLTLKTFFSTSKRSKYTALPSYCSPLVVAIEDTLTPTTGRPDDWWRVESDRNLKASFFILLLCILLATLWKCLEL